MRVAILVLGILGSLMAFSIAGCVGVCAGCMGGCGVTMDAMGTHSIGMIEEDGTELTEAEVAETVNDIEGATMLVGSVALTLGIQGLLGLIGCIMAFVSLGNGSKSVVGGVLLFIAVIVSVWAIIAFPPSGLATVLHLIAAIMAVIAPFTMAAEE
tara:strand:+ start:269 stop:733 length:465 start_codon:yes stop_codon:yes gene_type:complete